MQPTVHGFASTAARADIGAISELAHVPKLLDAEFQGAHLRYVSPASSAP